MRIERTKKKGGVVIAKRSTASKLFLVLLVTLVAVFLVGAVADAHRVPGCRNETPLAQNPHCAEGHQGDNPAECGDGIDNDGDGLVDGDDPDCAGEEPPPPPPADSCDDGLDNDRDDLTDEDDPECQDPEDGVEDGSDRPGPPEGTCFDQIDNDEDGLTDRRDPECQDESDREEDGSDEPPPSTCDDGEDNDGDGATDGDDTECQDPDDGVEDGSDVTPPPACSDGEDNDGDGLVDGDDPGCTGPDDTDETDEVTATTCGDPDGDGADHSSFDPTADETGPVSSILHGADQALPGPIGGDQGVVAEVNCALVAGTLGL
jgi:hypothetical protein